MLQFTKIEENEDVITTKIKDGHFKVQAVKLASDKSIAKIGFKCINLDKPEKKQSELVHQTGVVNAEYDSASYVNMLLDKLQIDPNTAAMVLPNLLISEVPTLEE